MMQSGQRHSRRRWRQQTESVPCTWSTTLQAANQQVYPAWLPSRRFIAAVIAIGGMQLLATMDSTVAIVALPKIQNELGLSDAGS